MSVSAARIGSSLGAVALACGLGAVTAALTLHLALFVLLLYAALGFGVVGLVFGLAGLVASRGERRVAVLGVVATALAVGLPVLFVIGVIAAFANFE